MSEEFLVMEGLPRAHGERIAAAQLVVVLAAIAASQMWRRRSVAG